MKFNTFKSYVQKSEYSSVVEIIEALCHETSEEELYDHMEHVAELAVLFSKHYNLDQDAAYLTGFLHDVGRLIDSDEYLEILEKYNVSVTEYEKKVLDVLHGKVATIISKEIFKINSEDIINGILYHTTLREKPSDFEKIIFLADKMTWSYDDLIYDIEETVFQSLNLACYKGLHWIINHLKKKNGLILEETQAAYDYFKKFVL